MTRKEVSEKFDIAESTLKTQFPRAQKQIQKKYKVLLMKTGRGDKTNYYIKEDFSRALTVFQETTTAMVNTDMLQLVNWDFVTFLTIVMMPLQVYRGSYVEFLKYAQLKVDEQNIKSLKKALQILSQRDIINYVVDKTDNQYFFAGIYRKVEQDMKIGMEMINLCKAMAEKHHKRQWVPLVKLWLAIQYLYVNNLQPYTIDQLVSMTGLSKYTITQNRKVLDAETVFNTSKAYVSFNRCAGVNSEPNAFHQSLV